MVTSWVVRSAKNKSFQKDYRVHTGACRIDVGMGAGWDLKRGKREAG